MKSLNVLMFTNYPPKEVQGIINMRFVNEGWVWGLQRELLKIEGIKLNVIFPQNYSDAAEMYVLSDNFKAYGYPRGGEDTTIKHILSYPDLNSIDVVHIMGSEFPHSLYAFHACKKIGLADSTAVSIQGLVSFYTHHYLFGVPRSICRGLSLIEIYAKFNSLNKEMRRYKKRGEFEKALFKECSHAIGRTRWDCNCAKILNPKIQYHYAAENLRPEFYSEDLWSEEACEKHSIFISQATYCLKGLHHFLKEFPKIIRAYPDARLYVGGANPIHRSRLKTSSYGRYLKSLIKKNKLEDHIVFCGSLSASEMKDRYLKSNVFISPSNIENSSNSIGEAMILGVPVVASDVGGTDSMIENGINGFTYPITEPYIMVQKVLDIFENKKLAGEISKNAALTAGKRHDRAENIKTLIEIYEEISKNKIREDRL